MLCICCCQQDAKTLTDTTRNGNFLRFVYLQLTCCYMRTSLNITYFLKFIYNLTDTINLETRPSELLIFNLLPKLLMNIR